MAAEVWANQPFTVVSSGGTTAPSPGTSQTWTVTSATGFPAAVTGSLQFHVTDTAPAADSEIILVTNTSGTTWTVTRGAESTAPVAHSAGFTITQVITAGWLTGVTTGITAWANVMAYGATGNGTTDDTAAIQAAFNAAKSADGAVYFPPTSNWYLVTAPIVISGGNSLTIFGDGYRSCIKTSGSLDIFQLSSLGALTVQSIRLDTTLSGNPTAGSGFNLTSCSNMFFLWVLTNNIWDGLSTTGSDTITMFGCFFHGYNAGLYTQNAIHAVDSQMGGGTYGIVLDSTSGSCSFVSCAFFGPLSLVTWNSLSRTNPNKGLTFINSGSNFESGNGPPPEGNGGINLNFCAGNVILDGCYNAGAGLAFGGSVSTFDTLHIVGGEYGGSGSSQADGIIMYKGTHITISGAKLGGTANVSSDIISVAAACDSVIITGNQFIGTCNYAVNSAATGAGTGEIIIQGNDFTGITSSPNLSAGTFINVPSGNISSYNVASNTAGLVTTIAARAATLASVGGTYTPSRDTMDVAIIATPGTVFTIGNPSGTALDGDKLTIRVRSGSTAYTPTWGSAYEGSPGLALPTSVTASAVDYFGVQYDNTSAKWLLLAYSPGYS